MAMKEADEDDILDDDDTDDKLESVSFKNILLLAYISVNNVKKYM